MSLLQKIGILCVALALGACTDEAVSTGAATGGVPGALPEAIQSIAAPFQDLSTARLLPEDRCYWYLHTGPVETTLLPLRTMDGRPICLAPEPVTEAAPAT